MKRRWARRAVCGGFLVIAWAIQAAAMEAADAPEAVTLDALARLYEAVEFDHRMHADSFACAACHHHTTGGGSQQPGCSRCHADSGEAGEVACSACHLAEGPVAGRPTAEAEAGRYHIDRPGLLGALHLQCLGCHRTEGAATGCEDCHAMNDEGRKRFAAGR